MANRDRQEIVRRLKRLLVHPLKWEHQPDRRTRSWELTIREQRDELQELLESGTLRNHAAAELGRAYHKAVRRADVETDLAEEAFPAKCGYSPEQVLGE